MLKACNPRDYSILVSAQLDQEKRGIAVIGLGMASAPHARSLQALHERIDVKAVYSPSSKRRSDFANNFKFPEAVDIEAILDDASISAVLLLTPPNARQELVKSLCNSGKHILMEKPLERTLSAASRIASDCANSDITAGVVFQNRFRDGTLLLAERIRQNALGDLHTVQVSVPWWRDQSYYDEPLRGSYERDGGGVLISQAIHTLDLMLQLAGPVAEVAAIAGTTQVHHMESEDFVGAGLRFESGAMGSLHATTAQFSGTLESICLSGTLGSARLVGGELNIEYINGQSESVGEASSGGGTADPMAFSHEWHQRLIVDFLDALDRGCEPAATLSQALEAHKLIDALMLSASSKRHVCLSTLAATL